MEKFRICWIPLLLALIMAIMQTSGGRSASWGEAAPIPPPASSSAAARYTALITTTSPTTAQSSTPTSTTETTTTAIPTITPTAISKTALTTVEGLTENDDTSEGGEEDGFDSVKTTLAVSIPAAVILTVVLAIVFKTYLAHKGKPRWSKDENNNVIPEVHEFENGIYSIDIEQPQHIFDMYPIHPSIAMYAEK